MTAASTPNLRRAVGYFLRLLGVIRPFWGRLAKGMALLMVVGTLGLATPLLTRMLVDEVYPTGDVSLLHVVVAGILALSLASSFLGALGSLYALWVDAELSSATRLMFFNHLLHLEGRFFDRHPVGEITSRFQDLGKALAATTQVLQTFFVQGFYLLVVPPLLFWLDWRLALVAIVGLPLNFAVTGLAGPVLRRGWQRTSEAYAELNAFQVETLTHIRTLKVLGIEHQLFTRARHQLELAAGHQVSVAGWSQLAGLAGGALRALSTALFTVFGWTLILRRDMSLGEFLAFSAYVGYLYQPMSQLIALFSQFQQSAVHLARMFEILDQPVEQAPPMAFVPPADIIRPLRGHLSCEGLAFAYEAQRPLLRDLDLSLAPGTVTALVGPSGCGKTSLLRLFSRLEEPCAGLLRIDGQPLTRVPLSDLRRQIAVVWQEVSLFRGTLWDNLILGADAAGGEDVDLAEVREAVRLCGLDDWLRSLPEGYDTPVGEGGTGLSSGQRQRVALVRAVLRRSPILLLDEATANLDVVTERDLLRRLFAVWRGRSTVVFVTHRPATAAIADQVCLLGDGRLVDFGRHRELLERCEPYRRLQAAGAAGSKARFGGVA